MSQFNVSGITNLNPILKKSLEDYTLFFGEDKNQFELIQSLIQKDSNLQDRKNMEGHLASQGFLFNKDFSKVLLLHHKSLDMWIQPGGRMDLEDTDLVTATLREVVEETGVTDCIYLPINESNPQMPISILLNSIPANTKKSEGGHIHIDLAYIFQTHDETINIDPTESNQFKWVSFIEFALDSYYDKIAKRVKKYFID